MQLTAEQVRHIAKLARINLTDTEVERFTTQMGDVMQHIEKLSALDTDGVPETNQVTGLTRVTRPDAVEDFGKEKALIACSQNPIQDNQIKVKKSI